MYIQQIVEFEKSLKIGDVVEVRWTNSRRFFAGKAEIVRINKRSFAVRLLEEVTEGYPEIHTKNPMFVYKPGHEIVAPRFFFSKRWSENNGVFYRYDAKADVAGYVDEMRAVGMWDGS